MANTNTTPRVSITLTVNGKPQAVTPELLAELTRAAYAAAGVPVQKKWVEHQAERAVKQYEKFTEIIAPLISE